MFVLSRLGGSVSVGARVCCRSSISVGVTHAVIGVEIAIMLAEDSRDLGRNSCLLGRSYRFLEIRMAAKKEYFVLSPAQLYSSSRRLAN